MLVIVLKNFVVTLWSIPRMLSHYDDVHEVADLRLQGTRC